MAAYGYRIPGRAATPLHSAVLLAMEARGNYANARVLRLHAGLPTRIAGIFGARFFSGRLTGSQAFSMLPRTTLPSALLVTSTKDPPTCNNARPVANQTAN